MTRQDYNKMAVGINII